MPRAKDDPSPADLKNRARIRKWAAAHPEQKKAQAKAYRDSNKEKLKLGQDDYHERNPRAQKEWRLRYRYGISLAEWDALFDAQGCACAICRSITSGTKLDWSTDHCHETGKVRGILCNRCNVLLGYLGDTAESAQAMYLRIAAYLSRGES